MTVKLQELNDVDQKDCIVVTPRGFSASYLPGLMTVKLQEFNDVDQRYQYS